VGADQVAAIRPAVAELEAAEASAAPGARAEYFARFSLAGHDCPWVELYLQQGDAVLNCWYSFEAEPLDYLRQLGIPIPPGTRVLEVGRPSCLLAFDRPPSRAVAKFVDQLFLQMYACGDDYDVAVELCRFAV